MFPNISATDSLDPQSVGGLDDCVLGDLNLGHHLSGSNGSLFVSDLDCTAQRW